MPERPLLIFPSPEPVAKPKRKSGFSPVPSPTDKEGQAKRIEEQFEGIQATFVTDEAGDIERVLVMETSSRIEGLQNAVLKIPGLEWLAEMDVDEIELHNLYDESTGKKVKGGRFYLMSSNQRATDRLLGLWKKYRSGKKFPYGLGIFKNIFSYLITLRRWDVRDRLRDTGILDLWKEEYELKKGTASFLDFEIELHYRKTEEKRNKKLEDIQQKIVNAGGHTGQSAHIEDIAFHALKAQIPVSSLENMVNFDWEIAPPFVGLPPVFDNEAIRYIRPVGQQIESAGELPEYPVTKSPEPVKDLPPIIALLDGAPLLRHVQLDGRLEFSDPDNYLSDYEPVQQMHGTAMASLICHGDLSRLRAENKSLRRPIYVRPVMKPDATGENERIPAERFQEDIIRIAIEEMFDRNIPAASQIRVINLSLGNTEQVYLQEMSPWARLLDWLAFKHKLLFIVSVGNYLDTVHLTDIANDMNMFHTKKVLSGIDNNQRNHRLLSPAESMNSLSVGSLQDDFSGKLSDSVRGFDPMDIDDDMRLPAPYSRVGPGYRGTIKPEVLTTGGRLLYDKNPTNPEILDPVVTGEPPGIKTAHPGALPEMLTNTTYLAGTSNAAAILSHGAGHIYEMLEELRENNHDVLSRDFDAVLIKTLLVHSASQGECKNIYNVLKSPTNGSKFDRYLSRYLGYGYVDISRVLECTKSRATAIGCGILKDGERHRYIIPLPASSSIGIFLRLTITVAWLSPINPFHIGMRRAKLWFVGNGLKGKQGHTRLESDWQQVRKGTIQHEIFEMDIKALPGNTLDLFVECASDAGQLDDEIPYGLAVTQEIAEQDRIDLYQVVQQRIRQPVEIVG